MSDLNSFKKDSKKNSKRFRNINEPLELNQKPEVSAVARLNRSRMFQKYGLASRAHRIALKALKFSIGARFKKILRD